MTRLSSASLYQPLLIGSSHVETLNDLMWPSYRRVSLEKGGDHYADFQISGDSHHVSSAQLERWFMTWIGCHFEEYYGGREVFLGYVSKLTLYIGGVMRSIDLDAMFNDVRVVYQADSTSPAIMSASATDATSIARYGTKQKIIELIEYTKQTHAEAIRDNYLDKWKFPRTVPTDIVPNDDNPVLEVYIKGYIHTLGWVYYKEDNEIATDTTLSSHLTTSLLASRDFVTVGSVATDTTSLTTEADYVLALDRIASLIDGLDYKYGCFGSRSFDMVAQDFTTIKYYRDAYNQRQGFISQGRYVPEPLVTPGGWVYTRDVFAGWPDEADLKDDPRTDWAGTIEYSQDGVVVLDGELPDDSYNADALKLALGHEIGETDKQRPMPWLGSRYDAVKG